MFKQKKPTYVLEIAQVLRDKFYTVIIDRKLYLAHVICQMERMYLLSYCPLQLIKIIKFKQVKNLIYLGKHQLQVKFFSGKDMRVRVLILDFLSTTDRQEFVNDFIPFRIDDEYHHNRGTRMNFIRSLILSMIELAQEGSEYSYSIVNFLINSSISKLRKRKSSVMYIPDVYDILTTMYSSWGNNNFLSNVILFSQCYIFRRLYNLLFFNLANVRTDPRQIQERCESMVKSRRKHKYGIYCKPKERGDGEIIPHRRPRHNRLIEKRSSKLSLVNTIIRRKTMTNTNSDKIIENKVVVNFKPDFESLCFRVSIPKYFGAKENKMLVIEKDGSFTLYKKDKIEDNICNTYMVSDILNMENDPNLTTLNLILMVKDSQKTLSIDFSTPLELYIFKSVVYNFLLNRTTQNNQLKLNVNIITWNVAGIDVPEDLCTMFTTSELDNIDIITIGVQECSLFKINDWQKHIRTLMGYYGFDEVTGIEMCQMFLRIFAKKEMLPYIDSIETDYKPMGFAKVIGNKGGIVCSFKFLGYRLVFVNCHLAPKPLKVVERNTMAKNLTQLIKIGENFADFDVLADYLFWQGDLNYRIDMTFDETIDELNKGNIKLLLEKDQLINQREHNLVFYNFQEHEINFAPTYRRKRGSEEYSNKNNQAPSWCDRIMVKTNRNVDIHLYDSLKHIMHSDHLPVESKFSIYLTIPAMSDSQKSLNQGVMGKLTYSKIYLNYNFRDCFRELENEIKYPLKLKIEVYYFLNKQTSESSQIEVMNENFINSIYFGKIQVPLAAQIIFDFPHARAQNIFFVVKMKTTSSKSQYEIGYGKYSLESIEQMNLNLLSHSYAIDITWKLKKMGSLSFNAVYTI